MDNSYLYTKKFIDEKVKKLNLPLVVSDNIKSILESQNNDDEELLILTESQFNKVLAKLNTQIKRHNKTQFNAQRKNQIIQQILKAEQNKLLIVNEQMMKIKVIMKPILIPNYDNKSYEQDSLNELEELVNELPESKYLFAEEEDSDEDPSSSRELEEDTGVLIEDTEERIEGPLSKGQRRKQFKKEIINQLKLNTPEYESRSSLLQKYESLRLDLIRLAHDIRYGVEKLEYLKSFKDGLARALGKNFNKNDMDNEVYDSDEGYDFEKSELDLDATNLQDEMNRFNNLVNEISDKLAKKSSNDNEVMNLISEINSK